MAFKEHMVKREIGIKDIFIILIVNIVAVVLGVIAFSYVAKFGGIALLVAVGVVYFSYLFASRRKKEFEYICTDDNMDIDVIMNKSKRKRLLSFDISHTEIIAPVKDEQYKHMLEKNFDRKIDATSKRKGAIVYFAIIEKDEKTLLKFEPTREILEILQRYARSKVHICEE